MRIKGWKKFQHFSKRNPPWIKLHKSILDQRDINMISDKAFRVLIGLWLIASEDKNLEGTLPEIPEIAWRLRISEQDLTGYLQELTPFIVCDDINVISERYQDYTPETETEAYTETEKEGEGEREPETQATHILNSPLNAQEGKQANIPGTQRTKWQDKAAATHLFKALKLYPDVQHKGSAKQCLDVWLEACEEEGGADILFRLVSQHIEKAKSSKQWVAGYVPRFTKYIEERRYQIEPDCIDGYDEYIDPKQPF